MYLVEWGSARKQLSVFFYGLSNGSRHPSDVRSTGPSSDWLLTLSEVLIGTRKPNWDLHGYPHASGAEAGSRAQEARKT